MTTGTQSQRPIALFVAGALALGALAITALTRGPSATDEAPQAAQEAALDEVEPGSDADESAGARAVSAAAAPLSRRTPGATTRRAVTRSGASSAPEAPDDGMTDDERAAVLERIERVKREREAARHGEPIEVDSEDPTNQGVLGPGRWMAQPPDSVREALARSIDESPAPAELERQAATNDAHKAARALAGAQVEACLRTNQSPETSSTGRALVRMTLNLQGAQATVTRVEVASLVDLDHPALTDCIVRRLTNQRFGASGPEQTFEVLAPLFFQNARLAKWP